MESMPIIPLPGGTAFPLPDAAMRTLLSGARLEGMIVMQGDARYVVAGNTLKLPLPAQVQLDAGQRVVLELTGTPRAAQLRITPIAEQTSPPTAGADRAGVILSLGGDPGRAPDIGPSPPSHPGSAASVVTSGGKMTSVAAPPPSGSESVPPGTSPLHTASATTAAAPFTQASSGMTAQPSGISASRPAYPVQMNSESSAQAGTLRQAADDRQLVQLVQQVLRAIGSGLKVDARQAALLIPPRVPPEHAVVRALIMLFLSRRELADGIGELASLLREALQSGQPMPPEAKLLLTLYSADDKDPAVSLSPERVQILLKTAPGGDLTEKMLASVARGEADLPEVLVGVRAAIRQLAAALRQQQDLMSWAAETGRKPRLEKAIAAVLDHSDAAAVQHLHGERMPYRFFDLSGGMIPGLNHALIHWVSDRKKDGGKGVPSQAGGQRLELDLSLSTLGDIWVGITIRKLDAGGSCVCRIRCADGSARELLAQNTESLQDALRAAGYDPVHVSVESWNGDRLAETIRLLRSLHPITLNG